MESVDFRNSSSSSIKLEEGDIICEGITIGLFQFHEALHGSAFRVCRTEVGKDQVLQGGKSSIPFGLTRGARGRGIFSEVFNPILRRAILHIGKGEKDLLIVGIVDVTIDVKVSFDRAEPTVDVLRLAIEGFGGFNLDFALRGGGGSGHRGSRS